MNTIVENMCKYGLLAITVLATNTIAASAETTLEKIKQTGKVTVGTEAAFPPFEFVEDGKIVAMAGYSGYNCRRSRG